MKLNGFLGDKKDNELCQNDTLALGQRWLTKGRQDCKYLGGGTKPKNAAKLVVWRGFLAKFRAQRRSKVAAHELISVALDNFTPRDYIIV